MPNLHLEVLPEKQLAVWHILQQQAQQLEQFNYYLAGGTALALQIGHRQSVDFDFFSEIKNIGQKTFEWLHIQPDFVLREKDENTIHGELEQVKVSFIGGYKYPLVESLKKEEAISLASIKEIGLMKLLAITNRSTIRDYIDLAVIIRDHISLPDLLESSQKKYGANFNTMILLRALVSFNDLDPEHPTLLDKTLANTWQQILRDAVKKVAA